MKRIGLISDTHGYFGEDVIKYLHEVDEIWHAGDIGDLTLLDQMRAMKPTRVVYGNIDDHILRRSCNAIESFEVEGVKVYMTHIAGRPEKMPEAIKTVILKNKPDVLICGHSHIALVKYIADHKLLWMNPGACGIKGFHKARTLFRFTVDAGKCKDFEVIELNRYPSQALSQDATG